MHNAVPAAITEESTMHEDFNRDAAAIDGYYKKLVKALPEALGEIRVPDDRFMLNGLDVQVGHGTSGDFHDFSIAASTGITLDSTAVQAIENQPWTPGHRIQEYRPAQCISFERSWSINTEGELVCRGWIESYSRELAHLERPCDPDNVEHFGMVARVLAAVMFDASSAAHDADLLKDACMPLERIAQLGEQPRFVKMSDSKDGLWTGSLGPYDVVAIVGKPFIDGAGERCCPVTIDIDKAALPTPEEERSISERFGGDGWEPSFFQRAWGMQTENSSDTNKTRCISGWHEPNSTEFDFLWYPGPEDARFTDDEGFTARLADMTLKDLVTMVRSLYGNMSAATEALSKLASAALGGGVRIERPSRR